MKHLFSIFSMLVLVALSVGCSDKNLMDSVDKEETVKRLYPTGEQKPVEVSEVYGHLSYDEEKKIWIISCLDFPLAGGDEVGVSLIAENIPNDFLDYSGKVCLKGVVTYLYTDVYTYSEFVMRRIVFYSLQVNRMEKVAESRSNSSNLICRTQAIDPPLWLNNPSSRTTNNNEW